MHNFENGRCVSNVVFIMGLTLPEIDQANLTLVMQLNSGIGLQMPKVSVSAVGLETAVLGDKNLNATSIRNVTINTQGLGSEHHLSSFYDKELSALPFENGFRFTRNDTISLHPANARFPADFATLYSTGFVCRNTGDGPAPRTEICGVIFQSWLFGWTSQAPMTPKIQTELEHLQLLGRELREGATEPATIVRPAAPGVTYHLQWLPGLQYIRFLAEFRTVVLLLQAQGEQIKRRTPSF